MNKPRFYLMDLNNYSNEFLQEIILWYDKELKGIQKLPNEKILEKENMHYPPTKPLWIVKKNKKKVKKYLDDFQVMDKLFKACNKKRKPDMSGWDDTKCRTQYIEQEDKK